VDREQPSRAGAGCRSAGADALVLTDGTRVELSLPRGVDWGRMPVVPYGGVALPDVAERDIHLQRGGLAWLAANGRKERDLFSAPGRAVSLWSMHDPNGPGRYVVVDFGSWVIGVWDGAGGALMTDEELRTVAQHLGGTVTDGFLVLRATGPLRLLGSDGPGPRSARRRRQRPREPRRAAHPVGPRREAAGCVAAGPGVCCVYPV
jgi:hypothetical protein